MAVGRKRGACRCEWDAPRSLSAFNWAGSVAAGGCYVWMDTFSMECSSTLRCRVEFVVPLIPFDKTRLHESARVREDSNVRRAVCLVPVIALLEAFDAARLSVRLSLRPPLARSAEDTSSARPLLSHHVAHSLGRWRDVGLPTGSASAKHWQLDLSLALLHIFDAVFSECWRAGAVVEARNPRYQFR